MIEIQGIKVDASQEDLNAVFTVFEAELLYDNRVITLCADKTPLKSVLERWLSSVLKEQTIDMYARYALCVTPEMAISIITRNVEPNSLYNQLYQHIYDAKTYVPFGYNNTVIQASPVYARGIKTKVNKLICKELMTKSSRLIISKAKAVYYYNAQTGIKMGSFSSCAEAAKETGVSQGNISRCCNGYLKTVGGVIWSYEDKSNILNLIY